MATLLLAVNAIGFCETYDGVLVSQSIGLDLVFIQRPSEIAKKQIQISDFNWMQ